MPALLRSEVLVVVIDTICLLKIIFVFYHSGGLSNVTSPTELLNHFQSKSSDTVGFKIRYLLPYLTEAVVEYFITM